MTSLERIGPHNIDILSLIIGSTLGETQLEKRKNMATAIRIKFEQSNKNVEYLMWFHSYLSSRGYCNPQKPKLHKIIKKEGVFFHYRINSYTFSSFTWIHEMFYKIKIVNGIKTKIKIIPLNIEEYLTPLALAIWFMNDGSNFIGRGDGIPSLPKNKGAKIIGPSNNCFTFNEIFFLTEVLYNKYNLKTSVISGGINKGYSLYISKKSMPTFIKIVKTFMLPSLYYKLGKLNY